MSSGQEGKVQLVAALDATDAKQGLEDLKDTAKTVGDSVGRSAGDAAAKFDRGTQVMIASIQRATVALQSGGRQTEEYYRLIASQKNIGTGALEPYLAQLRAAQAGQVNLGKAATKSSKEQQMAMRMLPAQMTDVVTSIAGGQKAWLVAIQQGGQIKDSFGGIGAAARALVGFLGPVGLGLTGVAAAGALLAYSNAKATDHINEMTRAFELTGNRAGMTGDSVDMLAKRISEAYNVSSGEAKKLAMDLAATGEYGNKAVTTLSLAIADFAEKTGTSTDKAEAYLLKLFDDPVKGAEELNSKYHFLTDAQIEYIKALEDRGQKEEAEIVLAEALMGKMDQSVIKLNAMEAGWRNCADAAAYYWTKAFGSWNEEGLGSRLGAAQDKVNANNDQIVALNEKIKNGTTASVGVKGFATPWQSSQSQIDSYKERVKALHAENQKLLADAMAPELAAQKQAAETEKNAKGNSAKKYLRDLTGATQSSRLEDAKTRLKADFDAGYISEEEYQKGIAAAKDKYGKKGRGGQATENAFSSKELEYSKAVALSEQQIANIISGRDADDSKHTTALEQWLQYDKEGKKLSADQVEILRDKAKAADDAARRAKEELTYIEYMRKAYLDMATASDDLESIRSTGSANKYTAERDMRLSFLQGGANDHIKDPAKQSVMVATAAAKDTVAKQKAEAAYAYQVGESIKSLNRQMQLLGKTADEQERLNALWTIEDNLKQQLAGLDKSRADSAEVTAKMEADAAKLRIKTEQQLAAKRAYEKDPFANSRDALKSYAEEAGKVGTQVASAWKSALDGMSDSLADMLVDGEADWKSYSKMVLKELAKIFIQTQITSPLASAIGSFFGGAASPVEKMAGNAASTGMLVQAATGGYISGPGTSTSDSIPARLSDGEYVLNAKAVDHLGLGFLDAANAGNVRKFANGGSVSASAPIAAQMAAQNASAAAASSGGAGGCNVALNITNQGQPVQAQTSAPRWDGKQYVIDVILNEVKKGGALRNALIGR
jgi:lambda family phage tail tape measure protein